MSSTLLELSLLFLRLGATAFGGPAAHVALLEDEVVRKRAWLSREEFLGLYSVSNLVPGPNSTELAIHLGYRRAGWMGLIVSGISFIAPAFTIVWLMAWLYVHAALRFKMETMLGMLQPVVLAVVIQAIWRLGRTTMRGWTPWMVGGISVIGLLYGLHELYVLLIAATGSWIAWRRGARSDGSLMLLMPTLVPAWRERLSALAPSRILQQVGSTAESVMVSAVATDQAIFISFAKVGSMLFGSGYVLLAFIQNEFVERHRWLTEAQALDAIAIGHVTPGPLFTTATFVGYVLQGNSGAIAATAGIFLPAFVFVALTAPLIQRVRAWRGGSALLAGLNAASLAMMVVVVLELARVASGSVMSLLLLVVASGLLLATRVNAGILLLMAAVAGAAIDLAR